MTPLGVPVAHLPPESEIIKLESDAIYFMICFCFCFSFLEWQCNPVGLHIKEDSPHLEGRWQCWDHNFHHIPKHHRHIHFRNWSQKLCPNSKWSNSPFLVWKITFLAINAIINKAFSILIYISLRRPDANCVILTSKVSASTSVIVSVQDSSGSRKPLHTSFGSWKSYY